MEENNNQNNEQMYSTINRKQNICFENHCWKKCLAMVLSALLGGFLASYFVMDQIADRKFSYHPQIHHHKIKPHNFDNNFIDDFDKEYRQELKSFDDILKKHKKISQDFFNNDIDFDMSPFMMEAVKIKTEIDDNKFNIIINLKPFQGDSNKVNYNVTGRKLTVFGKSELKNHNSQQDIAFSQDFILPKSADIANIQKNKEGKNLIISVPLNMSEKISQ